MPTTQNLSNQCQHPTSIIQSFSFLLALAYKGVGIVTSVFSWCFDATITIASVPFSVAGCNQLIPRLTGDSSSLGVQVLLQVIPN
jgi:hypothetical protein